MKGELLLTASKALDLAHYYAQIAKRKLDDAQFWLTVGDNDKAEQAYNAALAAMETQKALAREADDLMDRVESME